MWVYDLKSGGSLRRLTFGGRNEYPIWTRDGRFITFQSIGMATRPSSVNRLMAAVPPNA